MLPSDCVRDNSTTSANGEWGQLHSDVRKDTGVENTLHDGIEIACIFRVLQPSNQSFGAAWCLSQLSHL